MARKCRYSDCVEAHPLAGDDDQVTCSTCRNDLGLHEEKEYRVIRYEIYKVEYSVRAYDKDHAAEQVAEGDGTIQKEEFHDLYLGLPTKVEERV